MSTTFANRNDETGIRRGLFRLLPVLVLTLIWADPRPSVDVAVRADEPAASSAKCETSSAATPAPAAPGKAPSKDAKAADAKPADAKSGEKSSSCCGSAADVPVGFTLEPPSDENAMPQWHCKPKEVISEPVWQGLPITFNFEIQNKGKGDLNIRLKGG